MSNLINDDQESLRVSANGPTGLAAEIVDFQNRLSIVEHNWLSRNKMNGYVNKAMEVDIFECPPFPLHLEIADGYITLTSADDIVRYPLEHVDMRKLDKMLEAVEHDS
jgi:hypothetical protein